MGNPLSPILANVFMPKIESKVVKPLDQVFDDCCADYPFPEKVAIQPNQLFCQLNSYHPNVKFNIMEEPRLFLRLSWYLHQKRFAFQVSQKLVKCSTF